MCCSVELKVILGWRTLGGSREREAQCPGFGLPLALQLLALKGPERPRGGPGCHSHGAHSGGHSLCKVPQLMVPYCLPKSHFWTGTQASDSQPPEAHPRC